VIVTRATTIVVLHLMVAHARHKDPTTVVAVVQAATDATHAHRSTTEGVEAGAPLPRAASSEMYAAATTVQSITSPTTSFKDAQCISLNVGPHRWRQRRW
jgi:hypothetical protein